MISPYIAEFVGTAILLLLGSGIVANVSLSKTKGFDQTPLILSLIHISEPTRP